MYICINGVLFLFRFVLINMLFFVCISGLTGCLGHVPHFHDGCQDFIMITHIFLKS